METPTQVQIGVFLTYQSRSRPAAEAVTAMACRGPVGSLKLVGQVCSRGAMLVLQAGLQLPPAHHPAGIEASMRPSSRERSRREG